ncbi:MAG: transcription termination/antitermination protein NusA, partial [Oscillospiraceae bacterium]|nr:transcription termination/antitermination protein NusA [Oscillospiraceae bacterium]
MNKGFFDALKVLGDENSVDIEVLAEKIKTALMKAVKKAYPDCENININIDPDTKVFEISIIKQVVDDEPLDDNEIFIDDARKIDPSAEIGGNVAVKIDTAQFGRAAAQAAKQQIKTDLREINRENLLNQFQSKENECISAKITQIEPSRGTATLVYDKTELYLFKNDQIPGEVLKEGQTVKVYITGIVSKEKKPIVKISRTHKDLVKRLFELEVPEIYDGTVEIKSISREAGSRTKIAVCSKNPDVDAIGACIGPKRSRITNIVNEL